MSFLKYTVFSFYTWLLAVCYHNILAIREVKKTHPPTTIICIHYFWTLFINYSMALGASEGAKLFVISPNKIDIPGKSIPWVVEKIAATITKILSFFVEK